MKPSQTQVLTTNESKFSNIKEGNFVLAIKDSSIFFNVLPILYYKGDEDEFWIINPVIENIFCGRPTESDFTPVINELVIIEEEISVAEDFKRYSHWVKNKQLHSVNDYKNGTFVEEIFIGKINFSDRSVVFETNLKELFKHYLESKRRFYVYDGKYIYGPFNFESSYENTYILSKHNGENIKKIKHNKELLFEPAISFSTNYQRRIFLFEKFRDEFFNDAIDIDFISDLELISWAKKEFEKNDSALEEQDSIIKMLNKWMQNPNIKLNTERYSRLSQIWNEITLNSDQVSSFIKIVPETQKIKDEIEKLNEQRLALQNAYNLKEREFENLDGSISSKSRDLELIESRLEDLKTESEKYKKEIEETIGFELSDKKDELQKAKDELENIKEKILVEQEQQKAKLEEELSDLQKEIYIRQKDKNELESALTMLSKEFRVEQKNAQDILNDLLKSKTHFDFIRGKRFSDFEANDVYNYCYNIPERKSFSKYEDLRGKISNCLKKNGRDFQDHFIDNLMISINQNLFTVFAGLPGTGKTSLARMLTCCLSGQERTFEISVGRGWTSQKDLLGFYNPLSSAFIEAHKGLYKRLKDIEYEYSNMLYENTPLQYIILDEANLSPIEHYWSSFIKDTDKSTDFCIDLGQVGTIKHNNAIRFIGTINNDHTTELLSPRILDRINIINLKPKDVDFSRASQCEIDQLYVTFDEMNKLLSSENNDSLIQYDFYDEYKEIKDLFKQLNIIISPRIDIAVINYCKVASKYMIEKYRPLDYCIAQRLLPLMNIQGDSETLKILNELRNKIDSFSLSNSVSLELLDNIIGMGEKTNNKGIFDYFLTIGY